MPKSRELEAPGGFILVLRVIHIVSDHFCRSEGGVGGSLHFFSLSFFFGLYLFQVSTLYSRYLAAQHCHFQVVISQNRPSSDPNSNSLNLKEHQNFYPIFKRTQESNNLWPYRKFVFLNTVFVRFSNISDHLILLPNS